MNEIDLLPEVEQLLNASDEDRIKYVLEDKWISYPLANEILEQLNQLRQHEQNKTRVTSILLVGSSNNGKTAILKKFLELNPIYDFFETNPEKLTKEFFEKYHACGIPVLYVVAPPEPNESRLYLTFFDGRVDIQYYKSESKRFNHPYLETITTTHWRELPAPPKD